MDSGTKKPRIRFEGFTDDWEQRKLSELTLVITKGTTPLDKSGSGDINFIKIENIDSCSGEIIPEMKITEAEHNGYLKRSQLQENDILFSIAGTLGRVSIVKPSVLPANTNQALAIIRTKEGDLRYLTTVLKGNAVAEFIKKNPTIGAQPNLSLEQVGNLEIPYPSVAEQEAIGEYFVNLDHLITLHQRKYDKLKKIKKSMLQKMFPQNGSLFPEIRFEGFTDAWEQRKLGDIIVDYVEKNPEDEELPVLTSSRQGIQRQDEHFGSEQKHDTTDYNVIPKGYCTYRNRSDDKSFTFNVNDCVERGIVSKFYPVFSIENGNVKFITEYLNTNAEIRNKIAVLAVGTSQVVLSLTNLKALELVVPSKREQDKIGQVIISLDTLITLHQRKLEKLKNIKKAYLNKMFI